MPIDLNKSNIANETIYNYDNLFEERFDNYVKADFRINFKHNRRKTTHEWAIDLTNITNNKNVFQQTYNPLKKEIHTDYQTGFSPMFLYRFRF